MYGTGDVLTLLVLDKLAWIPCQPVLDAAFIGREQADFVRSYFPHESLGVLASHVVEHVSNHIAVTLNSANDRRLARALAAAAVGFFVGGLIRVLAADRGFVNLHNATELVCIFLDRRQANFLRHRRSAICGPARPPTRGGLFASSKLFDGLRGKPVRADDAALDKFDDFPGHQFSDLIVAVAKAHDNACSLKGDGHFIDHFGIKCLTCKKRLIGIGALFRELWQRSSK